MRTTVNRGIILFFITGMLWFGTSGQPVSAQNSKDSLTLYAENSGTGKKKTGGTYAAIELGSLDDDDTLVFTCESGKCSTVTVHGITPGGAWKTLYSGALKNRTVKQLVGKKRGSYTSLGITVNGPGEKYTKKAARMAIVKKSAEKKNPRVNIAVNSQWVVKDTDNIYDNGILLAPAEKSFKLLESVIRTDLATKRMLVLVSDKQLIFTADTSAVTVNGAARNLGAMTKLIDGQFYIPIRPVADILGYYNGFDMPNNTVTVVSDMAKFSHSVSAGDRDRLVQEKAEQLFKAAVKPGMNDYQKVYALIKQVESIASYDRKGICRYNHRPYGVLVAGKAICNGYMETMKMLLDKAGIKNQTVHGSTQWPGQRKEMHAWNLVTINGESFHIDVTHSDNNYAKTKVESEKHLFISDSGLEKSEGNYIWYNRERYPKCGPYSEETLKIISDTKNGK